MSEPKIERLDWWEMEFEGVRYVRLGEHNWAQWMGESLEIIQFDWEQFEELFQSYKPAEKEP